MTKFCAHEKHGGICEKTDSFCNLGACPYEDLKEYAPVRHERWETITDPYGRIEGWLCECGRESKEKCNYCPYCGAKMDTEG